MHKNMLSSLPNVIGKLSALQKLDISENKLSELPISICELSEGLQLSVGRNPLERPSVEQARQGVGVIRRFFSWSPAKDDVVDDMSQLRLLPETWTAAGGKARPPERAQAQPSRHDWASPGGITLVFNCHGCKFRLVEGSDPAPLLSEGAVGGAVTLTAHFNMQVIGHMREASGPNCLFAERLEFDNVWLPWSSQVPLPGESPKLLIQAKGRGKAHVNIVATPWLSYACSIGAKVKTTSSYATVISRTFDDRVEIVRDNAATNDVKKQLVEPRPDVIKRTLSPSYKSGQKLMLVHDGHFVDAVVEEWFGLRHGSRHRLRLKIPKVAAEDRKEDVLEVRKRSLND